MRTLQLVGQIIDLVRTYGIDPSCINLEITETSATFSLEAIEANVRKLAAHDITFSLDDYGTGYSSVVRALQLPVSLIKFDRSFVRSLDDPKSRCVLARSIAMMKEIGKSVLVEGVETREQAKALRSMGAEYIQGYVYAKPIPQDEFIAFIQRPVEE
ncbi:MAG: EAL domain-containing protein [Atopobiaceae bacterium]|nr:EAL domain-containing protein [Atopobiaceae bacterium]